MSILKKAPAGADVLDLGAARAARAEARSKDGKGNPFIKLSAGYVEVKAEVEVNVSLELTAGHIHEALTMMVVDPADAEVLLGDGLTAQDLNEMAQFSAGLTLGELRASPKP